jgi:hypothetical protein
MIHAGDKWAMSTPKTPAISIGSQSKYVPLTLPHSGDINQALATVPKDEGPETGPQQFMLVLGEDLFRFALKSDAGDARDISLVMNADAFSDLVGIAARDTGVDLEDGCREVIIRYRVFGRPLGGNWTEYLHGPLTFECGDEDADKDGSGDNEVSPGGDGAGPFDGNYAPAFE